MSRSTFTQPNLLEVEKPAPRTITTHTSHEFYEACRRCRAGEFKIYSIAVGKNNGEWVLTVSKPIQNP